MREEFGLEPTKFQKPAVEASALPLSRGTRSVAAERYAA